MAAAAKTALQRDLSDRKHAIRKKLPRLLRPIVRQIGGGCRPEPGLKASPAGSGAHIRGGGDLAQLQGLCVMGGDEGEHLLDPLVICGGMPAFVKRLCQLEQKSPELQKPLRKLQLIPSGFSSYRR